MTTQFNQYTVLAKRMLALGLLSATAFPAYAEPLVANNAGLYGVPLPAAPDDLNRAGGIRLADTLYAYPVLSVGFGTDSNTGRNPDLAAPAPGQEVRDDTFWLTSVGLDLVYRPDLTHGDKHLWTLTLTNTNVNYSDNEADNISNSAINLQYAGRYTTRFDVVADLGFLEGEDRAVL